MAHQELHEPNQLRHKKYECEDDKSEECMTKNFADDIAVKNAHGANRECSTAPVLAEVAARPERFWR
jgi:hypothetical protein